MIHRPEDKSPSSSSGTTHDPGDHRALGDDLTTTVAGSHSSCYSSHTSRDEYTQADADLAAPDDARDLAPVCAELLDNDLPPQTLYQGFLDISNLHPHALALVTESGSSWTWTEYAAQVHQFALALDVALVDSPFVPGEVVISLARGSPASTIATLGTFARRGVMCHLRQDYHQSSSYLSDIGARASPRVCLVDTQEMLERVVEAKCDSIRVVIIIIGFGLEEALSTGLESCLAPTIVVYSFASFLALGELLQSRTSNEFSKNEITTTTMTAAEEEELPPQLPLLRPHPTSRERPQPSDTCVLVYHLDSSGTLEGVKLTHDNLYFTAISLAKEMGPLSPLDRVLGYLPLHHIMSQVLEIYLPLFCGASVHFNINDDDSSTTNKLTFGEHMRKTKPTVFSATPFTWSQLAQKLFREKNHMNSCRRWLYAWSSRRAQSHSQKRQLSGATTPASASIGHVLANRLVLRPLKQELGLECARACFAILAPMDLHVLETLNSCDIPVFQIFGTTETCGVMTMNSSNAAGWNLGSSGRALRRTQIYITSSSSRAGAGAGEVICRGRQVFPGYHDNERATRSKLDSLQWFHSGCRGHLNPDGFLVITEYRYKFVTLSSGENIPPLSYERALRQDMPELRRAVIVGSGRSYLTVLLVLKMNYSNVTPTTLTRAVSGSSTSRHFTTVAHSSSLDSSCDDSLRLTNDVIYKSRSIGSKATKITEVIKCPLWAVHFDHALTRVNAQRVKFSSHRIRKWMIMTHDISASAGELHRQTKEPQRAFIERKYKSLIDTMYP